MGLQGELASEHSLPPGGMPQQTEELAGPGPRAAPAPEPQARVTPPGGLVVAHGNLWMVGGWIGSFANLVEYLLSTYCVSGVAIRRD